LKVPLLDLQPQYTAIRAEILTAIERVCDSQRFIMGQEVERLEAELAERIGVPHAIGVSSGTDALVVALMALGIGPGDDVIVPTFSFFATAGSVARLGATPVFVDVRQDTLMMDADDVRAALTPRTKAVIPVHLFGLCADMDPLIGLASPRGITIIEDAAQALGATDKGRQAGTIGSIACFSFFPSKNLGAFGDAGLVTTADARLADAMRRLRNHGAEPKYVHQEIGGNFRLDALQGAVLRVKLRYLADWIGQRRVNAERYRQLFSSAGLSQVLLPVEPQGRVHTYHQFVVRLPDRDRVRAYLETREISTEVYYPVPFHRQPCFQQYVTSAATFPVADRASREVLALPVFPGLTADQQEHVVASIAEALR
jgi:dTDP-4-amino-4,6-dideoxygalactose transaminase